MQKTYRVLIANIFLISFINTYSMLEECPDPQEKAPLIRHQVRTCFCMSEYCKKFGLFILNAFALYGAFRGGYPALIPYPKPYEPTIKKARFVPITQPTTSRITPITTD